MRILTFITVIFLERGACNNYIHLVPLRGRSQVNISHILEEQVNNRLICQLVSLPIAKRFTSIIWVWISWGNVGRGNYILHCFSIAISYCFSIALSFCHRHQLFNQRTIMRVMIYIPLKRTNETESSNSNTTYLFFRIVHASMTHTSCQAKQKAAILAYITFYFCGTILTRIVHNSQYILGGNKEN